MLAADEAVPLLDYFGVPYERDVLPPSQDDRFRRLAWVEHGEPVRTMFWPSLATTAAPAFYRSGPLRVFADVAPDDAIVRPLAAVGTGWSPLARMTDAAGTAVASIQVDEAGNIYLPFDPTRAMELLLTERYRLAGRSGTSARIRRVAVMTYYAGRRVLPRGAQIALRRRLTSLQSRAAFPAWPVESSLHDLYDLVLGLVANVAEERVPYIAPWPKGRSWAFVLTHDVETADGLAHIERLRAVELELGLRSAWNIVPKRYPVDDDAIRELNREGNEVGVHGLYHDGRDLESRAMLARRLPEIRSAAGRWDATGFRAPALRRNLELIPLLGFDHDSSCPDTDPHGPDGGGCCSWLPFDVGGVVELPVTLPQDHTLFEILGADGTVWHDKTELIRQRNGMALLITHPDYMVRDDRLDEYRRYVSAYAADDSAWHALPHEVSAWWRRRIASRLVQRAGDWSVEGAAAGEADVSYVEPRPLESLLVASAEIAA